MSNYKSLLYKYADLGLSVNRLCKDYKIGKRSLYAAISAHQSVADAYEYHRRCMLELAFDNVSKAEDSVSFTREKWLAETRYKVNSPFLTKYDAKNLAEAAQNVRFDVQCGDVSVNDAKILVDTLKSELDVRKGSEMEQKVDELMKMFNSDTAAVAKFEVEDGE